MKRRARWLFALAGLVVGGVLAAWVGRNAEARARLESELTRTLATPVRVQSATVGWSGLRFGPLTVGEFLDIEQVDADRGLAHLFGEHQPGRLELLRPALTLNYDPDHHLLTTFPKPPRTGRKLPAVRIADGSVAFLFDSEPERRFRGIAAEVIERDGIVMADGSIDDPAWGGRWLVSSRTDADGVTRLELTHPGLHVTPAMLKALPFVPPKVWQQVEVEGDTPVRVVLRFGPGIDKCLYRVELQPTNARILVRAIDWQATGAAGELIIEDGVVELSHVTGQASGGQVNLSGTLDFRGEGSSLKFVVQVKGADLHELPNAWNMPVRVRGRANGSMELSVKTLHGVVSPTGVGHGEVYPEVARIVSPVPVRLRIEADGQRVSFGLE